MQLQFFRWLRTVLVLAFFSITWINQALQKSDNEHASRKLAAKPHITSFPGLPDAGNAYVSVLEERAEKRVGPKKSGPDRRHCNSVMQVLGFRVAPGGLAGAGQVARRRRLMGCFFLEKGRAEVWARGLSAGACCARSALPPSGAKSLVRKPATLRFMMWATIARRTGCRSRGLLTQPVVIILLNLPKN